MRVILIFSLLIVAAGALPQQLSRDVRSMGMGAAGVSLDGGNSLFANPAGIAMLKQPNFFAGTDVRFEMKELASAWMGAIVPLRPGAFGLSVEAMGFDAWKQQQAVLSYARNLHERFRMAVSFAYLQNSIVGYGRAGSLTAGLGLQTLLNKTVTLGVQLVNPFAVKFAEGNYLPTEFRVGVAWLASTRVLLALQLDKALQSELRLRSGLEYTPVKRLQLRFGFSSSPAEFSGGFGLELTKGIYLESATSYHQVLGFSPAILIRYAAGW